MGYKGRSLTIVIPKMMCTSLFHNGVPATTIMQPSGHKNVTSINNYTVDYQQKKICSILSGESDGVDECMLV